MAAGKARKPNIPSDINIATIALTGQRKKILFIFTFTYFRSSLTWSNDVSEEMRARVLVRNGVYYHFKNILLNRDTKP